MSAESRVGFSRRGFTVAVLKGAGIRPEVRECSNLILCQSIPSVFGPFTNCWILVKLDTDVHYLEFSTGLWWPTAPALVVSSAICHYGRRTEQ